MIHAPPSTFSSLQWVNKKTTVTTKVQLLESLCILLRPKREKNSDFLLIDTLNKDVGHLNGKTFQAPPLFRPWGWWLDASSSTHLMGRTLCQLKKKTLNTSNELDTGTYPVSFMTEKSHSWNINLAGNAWTIMQHPFANLVFESC